MLFTIPNLLWGQAEPDATEDENTDDTEQEDEQTITKSELESILQEERDRIATETKKTLEKEYKSQLRPDKIAGLDWDDAVKLVQQSVSEEEDEEEESEEIKALRAGYDAKVEKLEKDAEQDKIALEKIEQALATERIDNAILKELRKHNVHSEEMIMKTLRDSVKLDDDKQPRVFTDEGKISTAPKTVPTSDGGERIKIEERTIEDLVEDFFKEEGNDHFLRASPREGSGARSSLPLGKQEAFDAEYEDEKKKSTRRGKPTPKFLKMQAQRKLAAA